MSIFDTIPLSRNISFLTAAINLLVEELHNAPTTSQHFRDRWKELVARWNDPMVMTPFEEKQDEDQT